MAHIITLGNEKGGSGKSTTAMHIFAAFAHSGYKVGVIDLDLRQLSFFRYLENRAKTIEQTGIPFPMPETFHITEADNDSRSEAQAEEEVFFTEALQGLEKNCDIILIDCPGANTNYARMAHAVADLLITPMNESFVDFDLLARIDPISDKIVGPSFYAEIVWDARNLRVDAGLKPLDWIVVRNRMTTGQANNKTRIASKLKEFSSRIGFRTAPGFSERVIFRELFVQGLTLLDLKMLGKSSFTMSNVAARQELRDLIKELRLTDFSIKV